MAVGNLEDMAWREGELEQVRASFGTNGKDPEAIDLLHRVRIPDGVGYDLLILRVDGELALATSESGALSLRDYGWFLELTERLLPEELVELDRRYRSRKAVFNSLVRAGRLYDVELGIRDNVEFLPEQGPSPVSYNPHRDTLEVRIRDGHVVCTSAIDIAGTYTHLDADNNTVGYTVNRASENPDLIAEALISLRKARGYA